MGDPKKLRKKYQTPAHPWVKGDIDLEKELKRDYSLKNKKELWIMSSVLKKYKNLAKKLIAVKTKQGEKEKAQMLDKLNRLGLIQKDAELDEVLGLDVKDVLERRLQSLVFRKGLARTMNQARQFITHRHVMVGDKKITSPSYIVSQEEEGMLKFDGKSALEDEEHPERVNLAKEIKEEAEKIKNPKKEEIKEVSSEKEDDKKLPEEVKVETDVEEKIEKVEEIIASEEPKVSEEKEESKEETKEGDKK
jgi:small subunit ribosomal protein S4